MAYATGRISKSSYWRLNVALSIRPPGPSSSHGSSVDYGSGSVTASASASASLSWRRGEADDGSWGVELWAFWCGWVVLGSIVPSVIAFMVR